MMTMPTVTAMAFGGYLPPQDAPQEQEAAVEEIGSDSGSDRAPEDEGTLPERDSTSSTDPEVVRLRTAVVDTDPYLNYAELEKRQVEQAESEGKSPPEDATLPEKDSFRPTDPQEVTVEKVRQASYKRHGQAHDNYNISDRMKNPRSLTRDSIWDRAPWLTTHVAQKSQRYEIARQVVYGGNKDTHKLTRLWMPWGIHERVWTTNNSLGELLAKKGIEMQRPNSWENLASRTLSWIFRHIGRHERDGGVPTPLVHAQWCKSRGQDLSMRTMMRVMAHDGYRGKTANHKIRWGYCYDTNLAAAEIEEDYDWPPYIRAIQGQDYIDEDLMDRVEYTEETGQFLWHLGYEANWESIVEHGLTPGWIGSRTENYLSADHPRTGYSDEPGLQRPVRTRYVTNRKDKDCIYKYSVAILRRMRVFLAQAKSYAVLTKHVAPTEALISITRWNGTVIWDSSKAAAQKAKMIQWKESTAAAAPAAAASSSSTPQPKKMPVKAASEPSRWSVPKAKAEVKEEVSQPLPEMGSSAAGQEETVGQGEEVPPTEEVPQSLPEKGSKAAGSENVVPKWELTVGPIS